MILLGHSRYSWQMFFLLITFSEEDYKSVIKMLHNKICQLYRKCPSSINVHIYIVVHGIT